MENRIIPSKFYFVRRDTSIERCIDLMREKSLSFVLIEDQNQNLVGIFTLKDLLKVFHHLIYGKHLEKSIGVVMTRPVFTIAATEIHKAPAVMAKHKIRHLPVTIYKSGGETRVIGVVDLESLLKSSLKEDYKVRSKNISVYSANGSLLGFLKKILKPYSLLKIDKLWASKLKNDDLLEAYVDSYDLFFVDIVDQRDLSFCLDLATHVNNSRKPLIVLVSPDQFTEKTSLARLEKLAKIPRVRVFEKPINVHDIIFECLS